MKHINIKIVNDPVSGQPSVSYTILLLSVLLFVIAMGLEAAKVIPSADRAFEFFVASGALYFGRKFPYKNKLKEENKNV